MRSGTLNVPGIVGIGKALEIARKEMASEAARLSKWTQLLMKSFVDEFDNKAQLNGHPVLRLPHNLNMFFEGVESKALIPLLRHEIALSAGSACTSDLVEASHVISALGFGELRAHSSIRFGIGRFTTEEEILYSIERIPKVIKHLQKISTK
jgi:cysteine desulfurase